MHVVHVCDISSCNVMLHVHMPNPHCFIFVSTQEATVVVKVLYVLFMYFIFLLDVNDIKYVINFDFPNNTEDYIHRIGRTARAENVGTAYTFFTSQV